MKCKAVIFDLHGTLVDNWSVQEYEGLLSDMAGALSILRDAFVRSWEEASDDLVTGALVNIEATVEHMCQALGVSPDTPRATTAAHFWHNLVRSTHEPRPDAVETLTHLKNIGHKIGLISDCSAEVPLLWHQSPLAPWIDVPIFSCDVGLRKPDPRIYGLACERLGVKPQDCLYIGDGVSNELTGASQVGMHPVKIRVPYGDAFADANAAPWNGPTISALKEALALVE